jgi:hypothetical protein
MKSSQHIEWENIQQFVCLFYLQHLELAEGIWMEFSVPYHIQIIHAKNLQFLYVRECNLRNQFHHVSSK